MPTTNTKKYYTPKLDEFCMHFEYEKYISNDFWSLCCLENELELYEFFDDFYHDAVLDDFRVKCLDQNDFEDLGFVKNNNSVISEYQIGDLEDKQFFYSDSPFHAGVRYVGLRIKHDCLRNSIKIEAKTNDTYEYECIYSGRCLNKSELRRILYNITYPQDNSEPEKHIIFNK